ncbi:MAG: hypothetical protein WCJ54_06705, partial [Actinomycetota bacterium]
DNGYRMVYEPEAKVFVKAPLNIKDFIKQKARVRAGYYVLIKQTKKAPRTLGREIFWLPGELVKIPIRIGTSRRLYHWFYLNKPVTLSRKKSDLHEKIMIY